MKTVFSTNMVAHVWASQSQAIGKSGHGNFYFRGDTIYSYGDHFPIAKIVAPPRGGKIVLFHGETSSNTTSKHQRLVRAAVNHLPVVDLPPHLWSSPKAAYIRIIVDLSAAIGAVGKMRSPARIERALADIGGKIDQANLYAERYKLRVKPVTMTSDIKGMAEAAMAKAARAQAKLRAKVEKVAAEKYLGRCTSYLAGTEDWWEPNPDNHLFAKLPKEMRERLTEVIQQRADEAVAEWRNHRPYSGSLVRTMPIMLRLRPDGQAIETSKGAEVPTEAAKRLFPMVVMTRMRGEPLVPLTGMPVRVGHFTLGRIEADGTIVIGCHTIPWAETEAMARTLGLETA